MNTPSIGLNTHRRTLVQPTRKNMLLFNVSGHPAGIPHSGPIPDAIPHDWRRKLTPETTNPANAGFHTQGRHQHRRWVSQDSFQSQINKRGFRQKTARHPLFFLTDPPPKKAGDNPIPCTETTSPTQTSRPKIYDSGAKRPKRLQKK